jgi:hypothetical protein
VTGLVRNHDGVTPTLLPRCEASPFGKSGPKAPLIVCGIENDVTESPELGRKARAAPCTGASTSLVMAELSGYQAQPHRFSRGRALYSGRIE